MSFTTIYNYLKKIENTLISQDPPELQFQNIDLYKESNFNLKTFSLSIFTKIDDTTELLSDLKDIIEKTKNEIVEQINSNFNNYVTLISKLQTIDFLISNINSSLLNIKNKISNKMNLIFKYEKELKEMIEYISSNDQEIKDIQLRIKKHQNLIKCEKQIEKIELFLKDNLIGIQSKNYTISRKFMVLLIDFYSIMSKGVDIEEKEIYNNITISNNNYMSIVDDLFSYSVEKYFSNYSNRINRELQLNIISLIQRIYQIQNKESDLYEKFYDKFLKVDLNKIFEKSNETISKKIKDLDTLMTSDKFTCIIQKINKSKFEQICFLFPFLKKFTLEKTWSNCTDYYLFRDNYNSILNFLRKFDLTNNQKDIKNFLSLLSFYTYFQFIQNEICNKIKDIININENNNEEMKVYMSTKNALLNYINQIKNIVTGNQMFMQNITNFLSLIFQCNIIIQKKIKVVSNKSELYQVYLNSKGDNNNKSISFDMEINDKKIFDDYYNTIIMFKEYFKVGGSFINDIKNIILNEKFLFTDNNLLNDLLDKTEILCNRYFNNFDNNF